ncbi:response regulator [Mucilaginibacter auburnensis]|uniref:Response regulator receiver domain-containing protein n=1 Tax=Mucilaginibacter auburnensis TaxID=1457233 RepID=A0A2H9VRP5_9SPHI|nr:response regulator transcription factor [Mucilaginibacter auburnensis]PJJ83496.1 response regulator receiver domain-containing protein [Mucilaginibacter auburnensis]
MEYGQSVMIKILVVDDHAIVRESLCRFLAGQEDMDVVASATDGLTGLVLLKDGLKVNIVLTDLNMPLMDGMELTREVVAIDQSPPVIVLTFHPLTAVKQNVLNAGAKACLSKYGELDELLSAIRSVHAAYGNRVA